MWKPPPPPPPSSHQPPPDLHHHHHHHSTYDQSSSPYPNPKPQFNPPPPPPFSQPPPYNHHNQPQNYPSFYPDLNLPPPPPYPDYHLPPPPLFPYSNLRSPNFTSPIHDNVDFRVSSSEQDHQRNSLNSNELRFSVRGRDEWKPSLSTSFNRQEVRVGESMSQRFDSGMDVDGHRAGRYDSAGSEFYSPGYGGFVQRSTWLMDFKGDRVQEEWNCKRKQFEIHQGDRLHGEWDFKRQQFDDVHRSISGVRHGEFERCNEGYVAPHVQRKSALQRIVDSPAHNGNRSKKPKFCGHHSRSSKTSPFKVKYSSPAKHRIEKKGENSPRENTPVHVSFRSNSLVAKQIVAPSSPVDITNNSSTPRNRKLSKLAAPGIDNLIISLHEENQSPMKLPKSGYSPKNPSHNKKISELTAGSDWSAVNKNLFDVCASHVRQVDSDDKISSAENRNSSGDKKLAKRRKKKNLSEYRVPLNMQPIKEQFGGVRSNSPKEVLKYIGSKEICHLASTSSTETSSLVNTVDDHSHNLLHRHIGEATMESSMERPACEQSNNQESQLSNDYCFKERVSDITAAKVKEIDCTKSHGKCIQISPLEASLSCNTVIDQTCLDGILKKGISEEQIITLNVEDDIKVDQDVGFSSNSMRKRKERITQFDFSDAIPAAKALENNIFDNVTIDSDKGGFASPDLVGMEKEMKYVMKMGVDPLDFSCTNGDVTTTALKEATSHSVCGDLSSLVPVSSESIPLYKDGFNISSPAPGSSVSDIGIEIAISTAKTCSDPDVRNTMASHETSPEGKTINFSTQFKQKSTEVALMNAMERVGNSLVKTNLGRAAQVGALSSVSSGINNLKPRCATSGTLKYQKTYAPRAPFRTPLSVCFTTPKVPSSKVHPIKSRTWHRSDNESTVSSAGKASVSNSVPIKHTMNTGKPQSTSYIRKGNSLVRNPSPVATVFKSPQILTHPASLPSSPAVEDKVGFSESKDDGNLERNRFGIGISDNLHDIENNEPGKLLKTPDMSPTRPMTDFGSETNLSPIRSPGLFQFRDEMKPKETTENQSMLTNSLVSQAAINKRSRASSKSDCILLSNCVPCQLISVPGPRCLATENAQSNQILSSDGYYKTRMNQIIRTPSDDQLMLLSKCNLNKEGIQSQNLVRRTSTLQSYKGTMCKPSNSSLVWTLQGAEPTSKLTEDHLHCKRPASWKRNSRASLNSRATSMLRKLTLYRNQNTLYKRSTHGLSLRKYKVVAVGGCSLKWSKSIEKRSKKANEDATRAVMEAVSFKREQGRPQNFMFREATKQRTSSKSAHYVTLRPRGHIFRIGSVRYRMDLSRKTLRRVIGDGSAHGDFEDRDSKIAYVPTRLAIGKNEYTRIGNGNQLIRDPKKRIRMLANEKIRWSLHNVRQRSMKKRRFCQFYTRFGKCNKDDGKCPYIHDSSKIAVCTKFLRAMCSDPDCKLTHKVIPERMEDCSYFLQGMCSNENCPYRHVNVNPKAETCEGFLRGYCADGDECRKKHSYICHNYEETGTCPDGSYCKLHHPKKQKTKHTVWRLLDSSKGRYFGNPALEVSDHPRHVVPLKHSSIKSSNTFKEGEIPEFISLDDGDCDEDEVNAKEDLSCSSKRDDNDMDIDPFDLNAFIKPTRIMNGCYIGNISIS